MAARWLPDEDERLRSLASKGLPISITAYIMNRSKSSIASRASRLKIIFDGTPALEVEQYCSGGNPLMVEDIGGIVGRKWFPACRNGDSFSTAACDMLVEIGVLKHYADGIYRWAENAAARV